jgi:predicted amidohydrolase YtcJ
MRRILLTGGQLFDGRRHRGPGSVLVEGGRVSAVGDLAGVDVAGAEVVDVAGGLVAPGFTDAHVHVVQGGLERTRCDLSELDGREAYLARIGEYAAAYPERAWVLGGGWAMAAFPGGTPVAADLETVAPGRLVFLPNRDHHGAWVSPAALALAGIDRHTPDPADGRIERDADGHPTGTLHEGAMALVGRLVPATTEAEYDAGLLAGQAHLHSLGVTGWQDAIVGAYAGMDDPGPAYRRAAERGTLSGWVVGALWWDRERGLEQLADLEARREAYTHGRFRATSV